MQSSSRLAALLAILPSVLVRQQRHGLAPGTCRGMCPQAVPSSPHAVSQAFERLLARSRIHGILGKVVEEDAVDDDEADKVPLDDLGPLLPLRLDGLEAKATLELALEAELLLLGELAEVGRPVLLCAEAVAGEVEGRQVRLGSASEQTREQLEHGGDGRWAMVIDRAPGQSWTGVLHPVHLHKNRARNRGVARAVRRHSGNEHRFWLRLPHSTHTAPAPRPHHPHCPTFSQADRTHAPFTPPPTPHTMAEAPAPKDTPRSAVAATLGALDPEHSSAATLKLENTEKRDTLVSFEKQAQQQWADSHVFEPEAPSIDEEPFDTTTPDQLHQKYPKWLGNFAFPYMNGTLHAGHGFTASKIEFTAGFQRMEGKRALFPLAWHLTGMPIKACADKLVKEVEMFGQNFERCPVDDVVDDSSAPQAVPPAPTQSETKTDLSKFSAKKGKSNAKAIKAKYQL